MAKGKWKRFAIGEVLCEWDERVDSETLWDWISETQDSDLVKLFDDYDVIVWQPFEDWPLSEIANHITELAARAEDYETKEN